MEDGDLTEWPEDTRNDLEKYYDHTIERYRGFMRKHGYTHKCLGWSSKKRMEVRYQILKEIGIQSMDSVLDVGCGLGGFLAFLRKGIGGQRRIRNVRYLGIDIVPEFIYKARIDFDNWDKKLCRFEIGTLFDFDEKFDWVVESGIFNHHTCDMDYIQRHLKRAFEMCRMGVAFNFLTTYVDYDSKQLHYTDPKELLDFAKTLTNFVTIRHDYLPYEFTIYLYRRNRYDPQKSVHSPDKYLQS